VVKKRLAPLQKEEEAGAASERRRRKTHRQESFLLGMPFCHL
jgi:hypothetical protein